MCKKCNPVEYPFLGANEENAYRLFSNELESDTHTFFHGTAEENLAGILADGFRASSVRS